MSWLPRLQQRLNITKNEALTLLSLSLFLLVGTAGRYMCRHMQPISAEYYAEIDSLFAARSAADHESADGAESGSRSRKQITGQVSVMHPVQGGAATAEHSAGDSSAIDRETFSADERSEFRNGDSSQAGWPDRMAATGAAAAPFTIDINRATAEELDRLPRVGPRIAERIVEFRRKYGPFRSVEELVSVRGIGATTLELIRPHARIEPVPSVAEEGAGMAKDRKVRRTDSTR